MSRISRAMVGCLGLALAGSGYLQAARLHTATPPAASAQATGPRQAPSSPASPTVSSQRALLDTYCVTCHNERRKTAGLMLDKMDLAHISDGAEVWEKVVRKLRTAAMPPAGMPRPDKTTSETFASWLETALDRAAAANPNPGQPTVHRLNRAEYTNAIRDLLALEIDGPSLLPADDKGYGFDNIADVLSVSPGLLERYMSAARTISRLAIGDPTIRRVVETYKISRALLQDDRMSEDLPLGSRGGIAIRHYFPVDGEYVFRIRLQRTYAGDEIRGLIEPNQLDVRLDGARIKLFTVGGRFTGGGDKRYRKPDPEQQEQAEYRQTADRDLEVRLPVKTGTRLVGVAFLKRTSAPEGVGPAHYPVASWTFTNERDAEMGVESVQVDGPYNATGPGDSPRRRQIFVCRPTGSADEESCAKTVLSTLARRAYRRPVTAEDVQTLLSFYKAGRSNKDFQAGIELALRSILVSPNFLFRIERDPANVPPATAYRLSDLELAARLSFFLWSSIPDDELLQLAERGKLTNPGVLERQVRRMVADARSKALVNNFAGQWLYVRNMRAVAPDPDAFPEFDDNLREAFQRETELFVESQLREDRSVVELLSANYTFVNERLARHYQIPNVYGSYFRRVTLGDKERGGLLGQGSILTVTSYANRTSPVLRGKWLLENILGAPPPPPPPNVPDLKDHGEDGKPASVRERMEQHRKNPVCASCHKQMDPLGFALENFDAIGGWRTISEAGTPIDASGALPNGTQFQGSAGLRKLLLSRREEFVTTVTEKLLTYALGRGVEYYDAPAVRAIAREAAPDDYRWSSIILGIVKSMPFRMRRSES